MDRQHDKHLFTIGVVAYKNYRYIKDAINSIITQDYSNIQLIISNDGSVDFDKEDLEKYLEENKKENIKEIIINNNKENIGTVKNVEYIRKHAKGEFYMLLAADDALYDETVITKFVNEFNKLGEDALVLSGLAAMCSEDITEIEYYEPSDDAIESIIKSDSRKMFNRLSHTYTIPAASTCYRKRVFDVVGSYDLEYQLIEDAPLFIKLAHIGVKFYWKKNFIAIRHRDGGVSHGNNKGSSATLRKYQDDELLFYEKEVIPFKNEILKKDYDLAMDKYNFCKFRYYINYLREDMNILQRVNYLYNEMPYMFKIKIKENLIRFSKNAYNICRELLIVLALIIFVANNVKKWIKS